MKPGNQRDLEHGRFESNCSLHRHILSAVWFHRLFRPRLADPAVEGQVSRNHENNFQQVLAARTRGDHFSGEWVAKGFFSAVRLSGAVIYGESSGSFSCWCEQKIKKRFSPAARPFHCLGILRAHNHRYRNSLVFKEHSFGMGRELHRTFSATRLRASSRDGRNIAKLF